MANRKRKIKNGTPNMRLWTIICLVLVCVAAIALRGYIVFKFYPLDYKEEIIKYVAEYSDSKYSIDKYFVCAIICAESHFKKDAVSHTGAIGLMQIMPDTGEWAAKKMGIKSYNDNMLFKPDTNISIGCWYLDYLSGLFKGDKRNIIAAYNAGPAKVQEWIDSGSMDDIPYQATDNYLKIVEKNYEIYKGLYEDF
jgi:soluble lytic murein transglycosylase